MVNFFGRRIENILPFTLGSAVAVPFNVFLRFLLLEESFGEAIVNALLIFIFLNLLSFAVYILVEFFYYGYLAFNYKVPLGAVYYAVDTLETPLYILPYILDEMNVELVDLYEKRNGFKNTLD